MFSYKWDKRIPIIIMQVMQDAEIRAACIQVLFSAVYHLKSAVLPFSSDLLKLSLKYLEERTEKVLRFILHIFI